MAPPRQVLPRSVGRSGSRPVARCRRAAAVRRRRHRCGAGSAAVGLGPVDDRAVHDRDDRPQGRERGQVRRVVERLRRHDDEVGGGARPEVPEVVDPERARPVEARGTDRADEVDRLLGSERLVSAPVRAAPRDRGDDAGPRVGRLDRRVGPERQQRAAAVEVGERERARGPLTPGDADRRARRSGDGRPGRRPPRHARRSAARRPRRRAGRARSGAARAPTVGAVASTSSAVRTAASPIAWTCDAMPAAAAVATRSTELIEPRAGPSHAARRRARAGRLPRTARGGTRCACRASRPRTA